MKHLLFIFLTVLFISSCTDSNINRTEFDENASNNILIGYVNREGLKTEPFHEWFTPEYRNYVVKDSVLMLIDKNDFRNNIKIDIVLATWCSDSRREVPHFYKILDYLEYNTKNMTVICVNTNMQAPKTKVNELNLEKVPLIIFYRDNKEIGRIIESPQKSLEEDMLNILSQKKI